jgi:hypothetical protein
VSHWILVPIAIASAAGIVSAQTPSDASPARPIVPAVVAPAPIQSPEVSADGTVTLRLRAPNAKEVLVGGLTPTPLAMQKNAQGDWSVSTPTLTPDLYGYWFVVDGLRLADPTNPRVGPA